MTEDVDKVRTRVSEKIDRVAAREVELGREGFLALPERVQDQLVLLQAQAEPKADTLEALLGSEHNLETYERKLANALDLKAQIAGEAGRRRKALARSGRRWLVGTAVVGALLAGGGLYLRKALADKAASCEASAMCTEAGRCGASVTLYGQPRIVCAPRSDDDCAAAEECRQAGRCKQLDVECGAAVDADCEALPICERQGLCTAQDGACVAGKVQDCRRTGACTAKGLCTPVAGRCAAGSDADCRQSAICQERGACVEVGGECVVPPEEFVDGGAPEGGSP